MRSRAIQPAKLRRTPACWSSMCTGCSGTRMGTTSGALGVKASPARSTAGPSTAAQVTRTSWPLATAASATGNAGRRCPSPPMMLNSSRNGRGAVGSCSPGPTVMGADIGASRRARRRWRARARSADPATPERRARTGRDRPTGRAGTKGAGRPVQTGGAMPSACSVSSQRRAAVAGSAAEG